MLLARRLTAVAVATVALALTPLPASAAPVVLFGWDMDQISLPRFTESGFSSVLITTTSATGTPSLAYLQAPFNDFRASPTDGDPQGFDDLWEDGHLVLPGVTATLRISGLTPGEELELLLLSHGPDGESTTFTVDGVLAGTVGVIPSPGADLFATQTLSVPVTVGPAGTIDVGYRASGFSVFGVLNGVILVPEPGAALLVAAFAMSAMTGRRRPFRGVKEGAR